MTNYKHTLIKAAGLLASSIFANSASAAPIGFGVDGDTTSSTLYSIDFATGTGTAIGGIGAVGFNDVEGISFFGSTLYGIDDSSNSLITIDTATGVGTSVGGLGVSITNPGFAISSSGLAIAGDNNDLWTVDLTTGAATSLNSSVGFDLEGLTFLGEVLFGVDTSEDSLYTINTMTGVATLVGAGGTLTGLSPEAALATDGISLFAADDDGDYFKIDPLTGAATIITTSGTDVEGLTIRVPEPATLFGMGLLSLCLVRRKVRS
ncbi:hypothetical protein A3K86_03545 [Photobacterium jeanii]|uniref:DUF6923 domain-containing protein n=1 Tax=Photobacterium jeanii TaxID=858640 RepID=A0A178KLK1_9GAMM|nr:PEP-CTERM sorting domain-containing protein [Photobacterium jeanii]OAN18006.1 hypothetical protein A3K86_03545 [Photobacterium jeanii]